jgi:hypothetical protein
MRNKRANIIILLFLSFIIVLDTGISEDQRQNKTNLVSIYKEIYGTSYSPEMVYNIQTPKIIDYDFILAIDSSGSIGEGKGLQEKAIVEEVPKFLRDIPKLYPEANFNISIVSWDDDVDFAYDLKDGFNNDETTNAKLVDLNKSINDISNNFQKRFASLETDTSDISTALKASFDILDSEVNRPNDYHKYKKFAILVVGNGEFKPATNDTIKKLYDKNYKVYVIGMDLKKEPSEIRKNLRAIARNSKEQYIFLPIGELYPPLNESLNSALRSHLENATKSPVAYNVKLRETFYCYYMPDKNSVEINGMRIDPALIEVTSNGDGTKTIEFEIPGGLLPNSKTSVTMNIDFNPGYLPVTVPKDRRQVGLCSPNPNTPIGRFFFDWFTREHFEYDLEEAKRGTGVSPSDRLIIQSSESKRITEKNGSILENVIRTLSLSRIMQF